MHLLVSGCWQYFGNQLKFAFLIFGAVATKGRSCVQSKITLSSEITHKASLPILLRNSGPLWIMWISSGSLHIIWVELWLCNWSPVQERRAISSWCVNLRETCFSAKAPMLNPDFGRYSTCTKHCSLNCGSSTSALRIVHFPTTFTYVFLHLSRHSY